MIKITDLEYCIINILSSNTGYGYILFGDGDGAASYTGQITYKHGDEFMAFNTNSVERMRINSSGNLQLGATSTTSKLTVSGDIALHNSVASGAETNNILFKNSIYEIAQIKAIVGAGQLNRGELAFNVDNGGGMGTAMYINRLRQIGIGTNSPSGKLHVSTGTDDNDGNIEFFIGGTNSGNARSGKIIKNTSSPYEMTIRASNFTDGNNLILNDTGGNVGIGTNNPQTDLHIAQSVNNTPTILRLENADQTIETNQEVNTIQFYTNDSSTAGTGITSKISQVAQNAGNEYAMAFYTYNSGDLLTERMRITNGGDVLMGDFASNGSIDPAQNGFGFQADGKGTASCNFSDTNEMFVFNQRDGAGTTQIDFRNGNVERGKIQWTTSGTTYNTTSDYRVKENLKDFNGLNKVSKIKVYDFNWIESKKQDYGVIAHELQEILPLAVTGEKDAEKMQSVDYSKIVPLLVKSIQELKAEVDKLKQECKCKN